MPVRLLRLMLMVGCFMRYVTFRSEFRRQIHNISHNKLKELMKEMRAVTKERYISGKEPKVELIERGFTEEELQQFFSVIDDFVDKSCFTLMATLGLRISELTALRGEDLESGQLRIKTLKGGFSAMIRLPASLLSLIPACGSGDKLFSRTPKQLRDRFAAYREKANLGEVYMTTAPCGRRSVKNRRFRLTTHSLRHYAIQRFQEACGGDLELTRKFARHRKLSTTLGYLKSSEKDKVENILESICTPERHKNLISERASCES